MAQHNTLGKIGEQMAVEHLIRKGYTIRETNWRYNHLEIDIVAQSGNRIIVVEVKTRASAEFASPRETINRDKMMRMIRAARAYLSINQLPHELQFDIITVVGTDASNMTLTHLEDAFFPPLRTY